MGTHRRQRGRTSGLAVVVVLSLLASVLGVVINPPPAFAASTVLFNNLFNDRTVDGTGTVTKPAASSGTNVACLTASGNSTTQPLLSCPSNSDTQGSGTLRLTAGTSGQVGGVFGATSFPTSNGLDVTFTSYQYGGGFGGEGMAFSLAAVDPTNPQPPATIGTSGLGLGYSGSSTVSGLANAYLGIGLDVLGNFSNSANGTGCANPSTINGVVPGAIVVRGPGSGTVGYCGLTTTWDGTSGSAVTLRKPTRANAPVPVEVLINPTTASFTSASGVTVAAGTYKVVATPISQTARTLTGSLPAVATGLYPSGTWLDANGVPKQLVFGFVGSTGTKDDLHELASVKALTFNAVPQLAVATTSYTAASPALGAPVTYKATASVLTGSNETSPISVTQTVPTGVVPVGAYGTGWTCQAPVGQTVTCTTTGSSFTNGTSLPVVTVDAIVTGSGVTSTQIQTSSTTTASSADAGTGAANTTTAGTLPSTPDSILVSPAIGSIAGGGSVTISGSNLTAPTAVEIGTTAEQQAGTPVVLLPCPGAAAPGCFTVSGSNIVISSMPSRASAATVSVTVVTSGVAAAGSYVYADKPAIPATPTATAGSSSATVTWVAPATNGSAITGYVVTPYLAGVAQTPVSVGASPTSKTVTGLTPGSSYTFTVAAVNAYGTSAASAQSAAVVPYTVPAAPSVTAATAGDSTATLTWTTPSNGGSPITGYVVTPYIGTTAQTTQSFSGAATTQTLTGLTAGTAYTFTVAAQNLAGTGAASAKSSAVTPNVSPSLTFAAPPAGEAGVAYSQQLTVSNGTAPFVWSVSTGSLPAGLTLNSSTGLLSGTPTTGGSSSFTVQVVDASNQSATKAVTLSIAAAPALTFTPAAGEVGITYSQQPSLTGGTAPYSWAITAGSLPAGVTLDTGTGLVSGTPTASGSFSVTIRVTDAFGQTANRTVSIVIAARPAFTATAPPTGQVGVGYSTTLAVTGGTAPLAWSVTAGSLPPGLSLDSGTGVLSGTPTTVGSSSVTITVTDANSQTATKAVTLIIAAGPLVITKTANASSAVAGSAISYTITIANTGSTGFTGVNLSDPLTGVLDDAVYNADATATSGSVSYTAPTLSWTGDVAAGATVTISYSVTVNNPDVGNKVLANTVSSTTLGTNCASGSTDPRCSATVTVPGLTIVKTADVATTTPGSVVHFSIAVTNTGQTAYTGATLTDSLAGVLDDATYNADGTATSGSVSFGSPSLTWTGNLAVGASATITYSVTVANPDSGNRSLTGTVVSPSAGSPCPSGNPAASCAATVTVLIPALVITNTAGAVGVVTPGTTVPYTITLSNTGQTAYLGTSVSLAMAGALDDAAYNNDAAASAGGLAFTAGTGTLTWTGDLAIGASVTITASVTVRDPDTGDTTLTSVVSSAAAGSTCPAGSSNSACTATVAVQIPKLTISTAADVSTATPGSVVHYTVSVTNTGQTAYTGASVTNALTGVLDDATSGGNATTTAGSVSVSGSTLTWTGNLAIGATATITYSVTVNQPDTGNRTLTSTVTSAAPGSTCPVSGSGAQCASSVTVLIPGLTITDSVDAATTTPGSVVHYTATVHNTGQTSYNGITVTLDLSGVTDDAAYNHDAVASSGSEVINPDGTMTWTLSLAPGATATSTASVTVNDPDTGDKSLNTSLSSDAPGSTCPTGSASTACHSTSTVLIPGLRITKTADRSTASPGGTVGYTVLVENTGQTSYSAASLTDSLATVLTDATYSGDATATTGTVTYSAPTLSWTGALAPGASATIAYSVTIRDPDPGDKLMVNAVASTSPGNNCAAGSTDARCTVTVSVLVPQLTIVKTASVSTTSPGAVVGYTITATNSGATAYSGATFSDALTGVLDDATYNGNASASSGTVSASGSAVSWTGDLAVGASASVTYSVTVHTADGGNNLITNTVTSATVGNNCLTGSSDSRCTSTVPVARLAIASGFTETSTTPGSVLHAHATFTNTGQVPYTGITLSSPAADTLDDAVPNGDQTVNSGSFAITPTAFTWTGSIPVGGVITITGTLTVQNPDPGNKVVTFTWVSSAPGSTCPVDGNDPGCTGTAPVLVPGLTISKSTDRTSVVPGGTVNYTITVHNSGQTPYSGATVTEGLVGVLDDATYNADAAATIGSVSFSTPALSWTGDLAVGATATITYSVTVRSPDTGDKVLTSVVASGVVGSSCPPASGGPGCQSTVAVLTPALTITSAAGAATAVPGAVVTYTITATNTGQTDYAPAGFAVDLTSILDDATYNTNSVTQTSGTASVSQVAKTLTWTGDLAATESATITYAVTVKTATGGDNVLANTVTSATTGTNCLTGSTDTRCTSTVKVARLALSTGFAELTSTPGSVVHLTTTYTNTGQVPYTGISVATARSDVLDDAIPNGDQVMSSGTMVFGANDITWIGDIPVGGTVTITRSLTVKNPDTGNKLIRATMVSAAPGNNCPSGSTDAACTFSSTVLIPQLTVSTTADTTSVVNGGTVGYTVTVHNTGQTPYTEATVTDSLVGVADDAAYNADAAASAGSVSYTAPTLTWTGDLAVGAIVTITYSVTVNSPATGDKALTSTVSSTEAGSSCLPGDSGSGCLSTVAVLTAGLTIVKTADKAYATLGSTVAYTVTVTNTGQTAYTGASFTDSLAGLLDDADYNNNASVGAGPGTVGYNAPTLSWTGDLAVGASATISYSVTMHGTADGDRSMSNTVTSTTVGGNCAAGSADARCTAVVAITDAFGTTFTKTADVASTAPGAVLHYTVTATNSGTSDVSANFTDPLAGILDDAAYNGDAAASSGTVAFSSPNLTWSGTVPAGSTVTVTYSVTVNTAITGDQILSGTLTSSAPAESNNCLSGSDPRCTSTVKVARLALSTGLAELTSTPGSVVHLTTTYTNTGQVPYTGISVATARSDVLDDAIPNGDQVMSSGTMVFDANDITWIGDIPVGGTVTITRSLTVKNPDTGNKLIRATMVSAAPGNNCPSGSTDAACTFSSTVLIPQLTVSTTADTTSVVNGGTVGYTITVHNTGQTPYTGATVTDSLVGVADDAAYNADASASAGSVSYDSPALTWTGDLAVGATVTITYSVSVHSPATGDKALTSTVSSTEAGSSCLPGDSGSGCLSTVAVLTPALTITSSGDAPTTTPGATVTYTITATNTGQTAYNGASFSDSLSGVLDDATYNGDASASSGTASYTAPTLGWSGDLAIGASATVTYTVTVHAATGGNNLVSNVVTSSTPGANCLSGSTDPRCTSTVPVARLALSTGFAELTTTPGSVIHLTATYTNTGQVPYTGISIATARSDVLDDAFRNGDQTMTSGSMIFDSDFTTWTGDIPVGGTVTVLRSLTVRNPDLGNHVIRATMVSAAPGNNCQTGTTDPACTFVSTVLTPQLTITKAADTSAVLPGGTVSYTITVHNTGETPYVGATVTDSLAGVLDDAHYNADASADTGALTFSSPTLTWTGDLAVGATATISYTVTVHSPDTGDKALSNPATSSDVGSTCPPGGGGTGCESLVAVLTPALTVTSVASAATTVPGAVVTYTITATNTGQTSYPAADFTVPLAGVLDDATYNSTSVTKTSGTVTVADGVLTWAGGLDPGDSAITTYTVTVHDPVAGDHLLAQTVASTTPGNTCPTSGTDPRCTTAVPIASLLIVNTADSTTTKPTGVVRHTVTITNTGQVPYFGLSIIDYLLGSVDDATYNGDAATSAGSVTFDNEEDADDLTWTGDLAVGATVTVTSSMTVNNPDTGNKSLTSVVSTDAAASNCPTTGGTDARCTSTVSVLTPGLTIAHAVDTTTTTPGAVVSYTITVTNTGETDYVGATVSDPLNAVLTDATYRADASATSGTVGYAAPTLTWTGDLSVGGSAVITFSVRVNNPDHGDRSMVDTVISDELGSTCPTGGSDASCSTLVTVLVPSLDIVVAADSTTATPGASVGYTVTIDNTGQTDYQAASVTTLLTGVLDDATYSGDAGATAGTVVYTPPGVGVDPTLTWTGDLAAGARAIISYSVTVDNPDTGNKLLSTSVSSSEPGSTCGDATQCSNVVTVLIPGLAVSTTADTATATPGQRVGFTITLTNTGETPYSNTTTSTSLTRILDDATFDGQINASIGVATYTAPNLTWTGTLHVGDTATISFTVTVRNPDTGNKTLAATAIAAAPGSNCQDGSSDSACTASVTVLIPGLTISQTASTGNDAGTTTPGSVVSYTILVHNTGETAYTEAGITDSLSGVLTDADYNGDAVAVSGGGTLSYSAPTLTWTGDLSVGASATITYSITVHDPDTGDKLLTNSVTSIVPGSSCPPGGTNSACTAVVRVLVPALAITKTADASRVVAGSAVHYTVTLTNTGETVYSPASFTDSIEGVLHHASYDGDANASTGEVSYANSTLSWTGALGLGATAVITYSVTTVFPGTGGHSLTNTVFSSSPGSNCAGGTDPLCSSAVTVLMPALDITKSADTSEIVAGGTVHYTITATNTGESDYAAATITDSLAGVLDDAAYNSDATASAGTATFAGETLTWTGPIPQTATVTISYSVTTEPSLTTGSVLVNKVESASVGSSCPVGNSAAACTTSTALAARGLTVTGLTPSFTLTGVPHSTVTSEGAVTMTVTTNSPAGYQVTVQPESSVLTGSAPGNTATIPVGQLGVRDAGAATFQPLSGQPLVIHQQNSATEPSGDAVSNDYQVQIPFVPPDTYSTTLDYIVSAQ